MVTIFYPVHNTAGFERHSFDACTPLEALTQLMTIQNQIKVLDNCIIEAENINDWDDDVLETVFEGDSYEPKRIIRDFANLNKMKKNDVERLFMDNWAYDLNFLSIEQVKELLCL